MQYPHYGYYDADPTQPPDLSSLPHTHNGSQFVGDYASPWPSEGPRLGSLGSGASWHGQAQSGQIGQGQPRGGGIIGELPSGASIRSSQGGVPGVGQRVARLRLGSPSDASVSSQQLQVYRKPDHFRSHGQAVGQFNIQPQRSIIGQISTSTSQLSRLPERNPVGTSSAHLGQSMTYPPPGGSARGGVGIVGQSTGGPNVGVASFSEASGMSGGAVGYPPQSTYNTQQSYTSGSHQPMIGRMPAGAPSSGGIVGRFNSATQQQLQSPFVPASANPSTIPSKQSSRYPEDPGAEAMMQQMSTGNLSALESISQFGSMSQTGSGEPSVKLGENRSMSDGPKKIKAVCSSGGHFVKLEGGGLEYKGGETRLVQIPNNCTHITLLEALERLAGFGQSSGESTETVAPSLKYQLPAEQNVYVDLVDDEDTQLMFDEWHDWAASQNKTASAKLHLFVDWLRRGPPEQKERRFGDSVASLEHAGKEGRSSAGSAGGSVDDGRNQQNSSDYRDSQADASQSHDSDIDKQLKERMEVISPQDITLVKFLGSGGYGEVYLGKWQHSEAAIKCLNPSLFFTGGPASKAAMEELKKEAALLGSLRHPNVVWVYGIVLPGRSQDEDSENSHSDESDSEPVVPRGRNVPHHVRPPAMVTEYMSQGSVKMALQRKTEIVKGPLMRVLIAMDAAKGMEYLHSKNIVHFDLKSANLLLAWRDRRAICKVADFGLSKQKRETFVSNVSSQRGTLPWIAPEIIKNPGTVNEKVDVFSFGVVLWELWTGKEPYDGLNYHALYHQMTTSTKSLRPSMPGSPDWDQNVGPEPAPGYQALMERCWSESPYGRPSFNQIVKALKDMATSLRPARKPRPTPSTSSGAYPVQKQTGK